MTRKKTFLEKLGLVESSEEFNQEELIESLQLQSMEMEKEISHSQVPQMSLQFEEDEDFLIVSEIYEKAEISDLSKSIFKAEEFEKHLPSGLPSEVKRQSVIGILTASGLEVNELLGDAEKRISALKEVSAMTTEKSNLVIAEKEQETIDLLNKIDSLKQDIINRKTAQEKQDGLINDELTKIGQILNFISPK